MKKNHMKAIKGLSIAGIAVAGAYIFLLLVAAIAVAIIGPAVVSYFGDGLTYELLDDYGMYGYGYGGHGMGGNYGGYDGYYSGATAAALGAAFGTATFALVLCALISAVCLVAGIITLRSYKDPGNYGKIFGWGIAASICGLFGSGGVLTVLFVLITVFAGMDRKLYSKGAFCDEKGYFYMPAPNMVGGMGGMPVPGGRPVAEPVTAAPGQVVTTMPHAAPAPAPAPAPTPTPVSAPTPAPAPQAQQSAASGAVHNPETVVRTVPDDTYVAEVDSIISAASSEVPLEGATIVQLVPESQETPLARIVSIEPAGENAGVEVVSVVEEDVSATFVPEPDANPFEGMQNSQEGPK